MSIPDPAAYYDEVYSKVGRTAAAVEAAIYGQPHQQQRREVVRRVLGEVMEPGMAALELGCAGGWWTKELAAVCRLVAAVDVVPWLVDQAPKLDNVEYMVGDWNGLRLKPRSFDLVVALSVFEHEPNAGALAGKLWRWARPGAKLVASVPVSEQLQPREVAFDPDGILQAKVAGHGSGHVHAFRPDTLDAMLAAAGWEIERREGDGIFYLVVGAKS